MRKVRAYYHGESEAEARGQCTDMLSILDASEIHEITAICVFDRKAISDYRCYSEFLIKGEGE